jgi:hypothetical protein
MNTGPQQAFAATQNRQLEKNGVFGNFACPESKLTNYQILSSAEPSHLIIFQ